MSSIGLSTFSYPSSRLQSQEEIEAKRAIPSQVAEAKREAFIAKIKSISTMALTIIAAAGVVVGLLAAVGAAVSYSIGLGLLVGLVVGVLIPITFRAAYVVNDLASRWLAQANSVPNRLNDLVQPLFAGHIGAEELQLFEELTHCFATLDLRTNRKLAIYSLREYKAIASVGTLPNPPPLDVQGLHAITINAMDSWLEENKLEELDEEYFAALLRTNLKLIEWFNSRGYTQETLPNRMRDIESQYQAAVDENIRLTREAFFKSQLNLVNVRENQHITELQILYILKRISGTCREISLPGEVVLYPRVIDELRQLGFNTRLAGTRYYRF